MFFKRREAKFIELAGMGFAERYVMSAEEAEKRAASRERDLEEGEWRRLGEEICRASGEGLSGVTFNEPCLRLREEMVKFLMEKGYGVEDALLRGTDAIWVKW